METELSRPSPLSSRCLDNSPSSPPLSPSTPSLEVGACILRAHRAEVGPRRAGLRLPRDLLLNPADSAAARRASALHVPDSGSSLCIHQGAPILVTLVWGEVEPNLQPPALSKLHSRHTRVNPVWSGYGFSTASHLAGSSLFWKHFVIPVAPTGGLRGVRVPGRIECIWMPSIVQCLSL